MKKILITFIFINSLFLTSVVAKNIYDLTFILKQNQKELIDNSIKDFNKIFSESNLSIVILKDHINRNVEGINDNFSKNNKTILYLDQNNNIKITPTSNFLEQNEHFEIIKLKKRIFPFLSKDKIFEKIVVSLIYIYEIFDYQDKLLENIKLKKSDILINSPYFYIIILLLIFYKYLNYKITIIRSRLRSKQTNKVLSKIGFAKSKW